MAGDIDTRSDEDEKEGKGNKPGNSDGNFDSVSKTAAEAHAASLSAATNSAHASDHMSAEVFDRSRGSASLETLSGAGISPRESETRNDKSDKSASDCLPGSSGSQPAFKTTRLQNLRSRLEAGAPSDTFGLPALTIEDKSTPRLGASPLAPDVDSDAVAVAVDSGADTGSGSEDEDLKPVDQRSSFGVSVFQSEFGTQKIQFQTREGKEVSLTKSSDGRQTLVEGEKTWQSSDGKTWKSGNETKSGEYRIDEYGRLRKTARDGKETTEKTSAETHDIIRTMWRLESQYNVKFKLPGDTYQYEEAKPEEKKPEVRVPIRMPTAEELKVVEETFKKFGHLANPKNPNDFEGMRIGFVAATGNGTEFAELGIHEGGKPSSIHFGPRTATKTRGWTGLEGVATHEFTHQLQETWNRNGVEKVPADLEKFFGYERVEPKKKGDDPTYRVSDKDGNKWEHTKYEENGEQKEAWLPVESGQLSDDKSRGIDDEEMRKRMPPEKQPATNYFYHPQEAHAEAIGLYVIDPITLYDANPELYWQTKKWDQDALNARYGSKKDEHGQTVPRMIRSADGFIVPNKKENAAPVAARETIMKASTPSRKPTEAHSNGRCACHHRPAT